MVPRLSLLFVSGIVIALGACTSPSSENETKQGPDRVPAKEEGWGEAVNGLRMRLVVAQQKIPLRGTLNLAIELENVSEKVLTVVEPDTLPLITAPGESGYPKDHGCNTLITAQNVTKKVYRDIMLKGKPTPRSLDIYVLKPGQRLRVEVDTICPEHGEQERSDTVIVTRKPDDRDAIVIRDSVAFYAHIADSYRLEATYTIDGKSANAKWASAVPIWGGQIKSQPVLVEVIAEKAVVPPEKPVVPQKPSGSVAPPEKPVGTEKPSGSSVPPEKPVEPGDHP